MRKQLAAAEQDSTPGGRQFQLYVWFNVYYIKTNQEYSARS
jgi:hypothetical protein